MVALYCNVTDCFISFYIAPRKHSFEKNSVKFEINLCYFQEKLVLGQEGRGGGLEGEEVTFRIVQYFYSPWMERLCITGFTSQSSMVYREGGGGGTPLYGLYRYVQPQRVGFFSCFGHK